MKFATICFVFLALSVSETEARIRGSNKRNKKRKLKVVVDDARKLKTLEGYGGNPDPSLFPLQECEGDCDVDSDCDVGLVCFQRGAAVNGVGSAVPGCEGGESFIAKTDFCIRDPSSPTLEPTTSPTFEVTEEEIYVFDTQTKEPTPMPTLSMFAMLDVVSLDIAPLPLGLCQGDEDCLDELICFQRELNEDVSGCAGEASTSVDYCIKPVGQEYMTSPTDAPTTEGTGTSGPTEVLYPLQTVSDNGGFPLGICQGDCDTDSDCLDNMICFQRDYLEPVPGCFGQGNASFDYCISDPNLETVIVAAQEAPPTLDPTGASTEAMTGASDTTAVILLVEVSDMIGMQLGLCQGDCDSDDDCLDDLVCFQRDMLEPVPGCVGEGIASYDYCIYDANATSAPTSAPTFPTVPLPLGLCEGVSRDCETDDDCLDELVCFMRDLDEPIPGCGEGLTGTDYCVKLEAEIDEVVMSTAAPTSSGEPVGIRYPLVTVGDNSGALLGVCQGDCDTDDDCLDDLVCFQRDQLESVPGCAGKGRTSFDYCIKPPGATAAPTWAPVIPSLPLPFGLCEPGCQIDFDCLDELVCFIRMNDEPIAGCGDLQPGMNYCILMMPADGTDGVEETNVATPVNDNMDGVLPLGLCEGDCDSDSDCEGDLICFQRDLLEPVPGCSGLGQTSYDYCIENPGYATAPVMAPDALPVETMMPTFGVPEVVASGFEAPAGEPVVEPASALLPVLETVESADKGDKDKKDKYAVGWLALCQGDCYDDNDCMGGLICLERDDGQSVPGCEGTSDGKSGYCISI